MSQLKKDKEVLTRYKQKSCFIIFHKFLDKNTTMSYMSVYAKCTPVKKGNTLDPEGVR